MTAETRPNPGGSPAYRTGRARAVQAQAGPGEGATASGAASAPDGWDLPAAGTTHFSWRYDEGRRQLLGLYQRGKDKQWDAATRIDWHLPTDPHNVMGTPAQACPIYGSRQWRALSRSGRAELGQHLSGWLFSQFLHGEQGALAVAARIVASVPDLDAKFYAASQTMDEARHVEIYARFLREKIGVTYPVDPGLAALLAATLGDARWDIPYLGMQILIEGLALAAFGVHRDRAANPLTRQILTYVMRDEARHVAFGQLALRAHYQGLTSAELTEREDFVIEGCHLMRDHFSAAAVWRRLGYDEAECAEFTGRSATQAAFRRQLFARIVPSLTEIGLWSPRVRRAFTDLGVLGPEASRLAAAASDGDRSQERVARAHAAELAARTAEVDATIATAKPA